jgi:HAD superfamily hydrolase (TIGR01509 family)
MVGEGARTLVGRVLDAAGVTTDVDQALADFLTLYERRLTNHTQLYPGVAETLEGLGRRGVAMGVLTNKPQRPTVRLIDHFGLTRSFVEVIGGDTVHGRKPDPTGLRVLMRKAGADAGATLMVGDSWVDIETARRAGTRACFADYGFGLPPPDGLSGSELRIARVDAVLALLNGRPTNDEA